MTLAFIGAVHLDHHGKEFVCPRDVVIQPRVLSAAPFFPSLVLCSPARNSFSSDLIQ